MNRLTGAIIQVSSKFDETLFYRATHILCMYSAVYLSLGVRLFATRRYCIETVKQIELVFCTKAALDYPTFCCMGILVLCI